MQAFKHTTPAALLAISVLALNNTAIAAPTYIAQEVNGLLVASAINDQGQVIGQIRSTQTSDGRRHAALWDNGTYTDLGMIGCQATVTFCQSKGHGLNNLGQTVGESHVSSSTPPLYVDPWALYYGHEFVWEDGVMQNIRTLGAEIGIALDINDSGHIVGNARSTDYWNFNADYLDHGYVWFSNDEVYEIGEYGQSSKALAINNADQVTGEIRHEGFTQAYLWENNNIEIVGDLGGGFSSGRDVNSRSPAQIVGVSTTSAGEERAFIWQPGIIFNLGVLPNEPDSYANAINDSSNIVGGSGTAAVLWQQGAINDLNELVVDSPAYLVEALDINNPGQILVRANNARYYLLTPEGGGSVLD